jgi:effector-binding domain-containing protein
MNVEVFNKDFTIDVYGLSRTALNNKYLETAFSLSDNMWKIVKSNSLKHKGKNIWIYGIDKQIFAGVELFEKPQIEIGLEHKSILLEKYAYYKHIGPYNLIKDIGDKMKSELYKNGFETTFPYIEIYGHWISDESKLETELFICLK